MWLENFSLEGNWLLCNFGAAMPVADMLAVKMAIIDLVMIDTILEVVEATIILTITTISL